MKDMILELSKEVKEDLTRFAQELVRIKSFTGREEEVARFIAAKMRELDYDDVIIDGFGNVIGVIGSGEKKLMFDSHIDTVTVEDAAEWSQEPFGGAIVDGKLYGRGAADMKSAVAASVYAGYAIKKLGLHKGKTIYISTSAAEEDYDGENLKYIFDTVGIRPDFVVICEPSKCQLALGQKGRALFKINTEGVSAHGSAPEKGVNAVYKMAEIIKRVEKLNEKLASGQGEHGTAALTRIESESASYNAIPFSSSIYIDRRLVKGEDKAFIAGEMQELLEGTDANWEVYKVRGKSWTGLDIVLDSFLPAWDIPVEHELAKAALAAYERLYKKPPILTKWDFSTNGVASEKYGIPTIGFGPGDSKLAHCRDEYCPVTDIVEAFEFYTGLADTI